MARLSKIAFVGHKHFDINLTCFCGVFSIVPNQTVVSESGRGFRIMVSESVLDRRTVIPGRPPSVDSSDSRGRGSDWQHGHSEALRPGVARRATARWKHGK